MLLVIDRKESVVRYQGGCLRIERPEMAAETVPVRLLEHVVVYGNPLVEAGVWRALAEANVPTTLLALRGKEQAATIGAGLAVQLPFRRMQHRCANERALQLAMARYFVQQKLLGYALPLQRLQTAFAAQASAVERFRQQQQQALVRLPTVTTLDQLMGLEGQAAQAWFALLADSLPEQWRFKGRNRQPPRDPVNALLSLGYTLMGSEIRQGVVQAGLDPSLGFLHQDYPGRESMVLDVLEIFRASVDDFVLDCLATRDFDDTAFYYRETDGCRLSKSARPIFFAAWAQRRSWSPRPFCAEESSQWPEAELREMINGQVMQIREVMKSLMPVTQTDEGM